jgi:hypothetical protein
MAQYSQVAYAQPLIGPVTGANGLIKAQVEIIAGPTGRPVITEIGFCLAMNQTVQSTGLMSLGVPSVNGVGPQFSIDDNLPYDPNYINSDLRLANNWTVAPVAPTSFIRRQSISACAVVATPFMWRFPRGLTMTQGQHFALFYTGAYPSLFDFWVEWDN